MTNGSDAVHTTTRRESLRLLGASGLAAVVGCGPGKGSVASEDGGSPLVDGGLPACIVRPQQTEGPYFIDEKLNRPDIRTDPGDGSVSPGVSLRLVFRIGRVGRNTCTPLAGVIVDLWQCDALGVYAGVRDIAGMFDTVGRRFLRGFQTTDAQGTCEFITIYPGWYAGRSVHAHFKLRVMDSSRPLEFTSQLYFDESITDQVHAQPPYSTRPGRRTPNSADGIFAAGGSRLLLRPARLGDEYTGVFDIGLQMA